MLIPSSKILINELNKLLLLVFLDKFFSNVPWILGGFGFIWFIVNNSSLNPSFVLYSGIAFE